MSEAEELREVIAIQRTTSLIGKFSQEFADSIKAPDATRGILVMRLLNLFTKNFQIVVQVQEFRIIATNYETLLQLISQLNAGVYASFLVGSLAVERYEDRESKCGCKHRRIVEMSGVDYFVQANRNGNTVNTGLITLRDTYLAVECKKKILLSAVVLNVEFRADLLPQSVLVNSQGNILNVKT